MGDCTAGFGNAIAVTSFGGSMFGKGQDVSSASTAHAFQATTLNNAYSYNYKFKGFTTNAVKSHYTSLYYRGSHQADTPSVSIFDGLTGCAAHIGLDGAITSNAGPGGGSSGAYAGYQSSYVNMYTSPGIFAGAGGVAQNGGSGGAYAAAGGTGAGGGGASAHSTTDPVGGMGGSGMVVISILEYL